MTTLSALTDTTNGAEYTIELSIPYRAEVQIEGVADLLFHRWNNESVEAKATAAKGSKAKKQDDIESYVYRTPGGNLALPGEYLRQATINAAKYRQDPRSPRKSAADIRALLAALQEAKQAPAPKPFRAGDHVRHRPSGESWVVAYQDGEHVGWCGWPAGEALAADCDLIQAVTDTEHLAILRRLENGGDKRARMAREALAKLFGGSAQEGGRGNG